MTLHISNQLNAAVSRISLCLLLLGFWADPSMAEVRDITVKGKSPADIVSSQKGTDWAVVIGIDDYREVPRLKYAVKDAQGLAHILQKQGFRVTTLFDDQATRHAILGELGTRLITKVQPEDRVLVFYAGHGETVGVTKDRTMGYLVPVEGKANALVATGISMGHIRELANLLPARHVLFLMDVCYGGIAGQRFRSLSNLTEAYVNVITREPGRQLITAGGADQQAVEGPEWGHSVFTYYLLKGLGEGFADLNDDGIIPTTELYTYLDERVYSAAQLTGHTQRPELWSLSAEKGEFVFIDQSEAKPLRETPPEKDETEAREVTKLREELARLQSQLAHLNQSRIADRESPQTGIEIKGQDVLLEKDPSRVRGYQEACGQGDAEGCFQLATLYVLGEEVNQDLVQGATLFEKACRAGDQNSCTALGNLYWLGEGVPEDRKLAVALWNHACEAGNSKACTLLKKVGKEAG